MDKEQIVKHNLRVELMKAVTENNIPNLTTAVQKIFDAGLELEEMDLQPAAFTLVSNALFDLKWSPQPAPNEG